MLSWVRQSKLGTSTAHTALLLVNSALAGLVSVFCLVVTTSRGVSLMSTSLQTFSDISFFLNLRITGNILIITINRQVLANISWPTVWLLTMTPMSPKAYNFPLRSTNRDRVWFSAVVSTSLAGISQVLKSGLGLGDDQLREMELNIWKSISNAYFVVYVNLCLLLIKTTTVFSFWCVFLKTVNTN